MSYHVFDLAYHWSESILKQLETAATEAVVYSCTLHFIFSFFPSSGRGTFQGKLIRTESFNLSALVMEAASNRCGR